MNRSLSGFQIHGGKRRVRTGLHLEVGSSLCSRAAMVACAALIPCWISSKSLALEPRSSNVPAQPTSFSSAGSDVSRTKALFRASLWDFNEGRLDDAAAKRRNAAPFGLSLQELDINDHVDAPEVGLDAVPFGLSLHELETGDRIDTSQVGRDADPFGHSLPELDSSARIDTPEVSPDGAPFGMALPDFEDLTRVDSAEVGPDAAPWGMPPSDLAPWGVSLPDLDEADLHHAATEGTQASSRGGEDPCGEPTGWRRFECDSRAFGRRLLLREPGDAWRALGVLGTTGALYAEREQIQDFVRRHHQTSRTRVYRTARVLGKGVATPLVASLLYLGGKLSSNTYHVESAQIFLESTLYAGLLAATGQVVLSSQRPEDGDAVRFFQLHGHGVSGDVAIAASVVAPLDRRYLRFAPGDHFARKVWKTAGRVGLYAALALTAAQRMDADRHWAPDVFLGAAAGLTAGYSICSAHESSPPSRARSRRAQVVPIPGGLAVAWSF